MLPGFEEARRSAGGDEPVSADEGLEAAPLPARARRPIVGNDHVGYLPGPAAGSSLQDAIGHTGEPHATPDCHHDEVPAAPPVPEQVLGHGQRLHVVLDEHGHAHPPAEVTAERHPLPAQHVSVDVADVGPAYYTRYTNTDAEKVRVAGAPERLQAGEQLVDGVGRQSVEGLRPGRQHLTIEAYLHENDVVGSQLHSDRVPGLAPQADQLPRAAAFRGREVERLYDALADQAPGDLADSGRAHVQLSGDSGARRRPLTAEQSQHCHAGQIATAISSSCISDLGYSLQEAATTGDRADQPKDPEMAITT